MGGLSRGHSELVQHRLDGRLEASFKPERDVIAHLLLGVLGARPVVEAALAVVMTARDVRVHGHVHQRRRRLAQRPQAVVVEHRQTGARVHERLGRHLHRQVIATVYGQSRRMLVTIR